MLLNYKSLCFAKLSFALFMIFDLCLLQSQNFVNAGRTEGLKLRPRMRAAKIASNLRGQSIAATTAATPKDSFLNGKYEIRSVSGEPDYKSVNLTWEIEFVSAGQSHSGNLGNDDSSSSSNVSAEPPPKAFQIFYCELQSFGPHRCRSKLINESSLATTTSIASTTSNHDVDEVEVNNSRQVRQYSAQIDNLRMATKYSFHIRPQAKFGRMKISGRAGLLDNEIEDGKNEINLNEQTIIIPTKGFTAQATKCLPHASEIEVETGPYFGGKIVVDGGNCGVKGNPEDPVDKYTMRIDHKQCGSLVKPETNTVETFITVQENLGIFTHSTRRFVVVCSFQSGMQTVRASFTVPGRNGMADAVENDPFEPDDNQRLGREYRQMRYVDKSALVLKESSANVEKSTEAEEEEGEIGAGGEDNSENIATEQHDVAIVKEVADPALNGDVENAVATLEDIVPGINEDDIRHAEKTHNRRDLAPLAHARLAKYAKLVIDPNEVPEKRELANDSPSSWPSTNAYATTLHNIAGNIGGVLLTVSLTVIIIGVFIFIAYREAQRRRGVIRQNLKIQQHHQQKNPQQPKPTNQHLLCNTLPRSLLHLPQQQHEGTM